MEINPKQARENLGLNQTQMAEAMGVHRNTWLKWERGEQQISAAPARLIQVFLWLNSKNMLNSFLKEEKIYYHGK
jgi:transcriptional regulator with XRE-family HTH domain